LPTTLGGGSPTVNEHNPQPVDKAVDIVLTPPFGVVDIRCSVLWTLSGKSTLRRPDLQMNCPPPVDEK
jgi:hypothetical protein